MWNNLDGKYTNIRTLTDRYSTLTSDRFHLSKILHVPECLLYKLFSIEFYWNLWITPYQDIFKIEIIKKDVSNEFLNVLSLIQVINACNVLLVLIWYAFVIFNAWMVYHKLCIFHNWTYIFSYSKNKYLRSNGDKLEHFYPTFLDVPGFQNTKTVRETLKSIFEGHIQEGTILSIGGSSQR